jgi:hypothetical protein
MGYMKRPPGSATKPAETATFLSVSPNEEDHVALKRILSDSDTETHWAIHATFGLESALPLFVSGHVKT